MEQEIKHLKQNEALPDTEWIVPKRIDMRLIYLLAVVAPWVGFSLFGTSRFGQAEWQTGQIGTYFELSFSESVWILFAPFLVYASFAMLLLLWNGPKFSKYWYVRFGIYTGFILAVQFTIQMLLTDELLIGLVIGYICILPLFGLNWLIQWLFRLIKDKRHSENFWKVTGGVVALLIIFVAGAIFTGVGTGIVFGVVIGPLAAGVALCPILAGLTAHRLFEYIEKGSLKNQAMKVISSVGWITAYGVTITIAIDRVFDLYTQLPSEPPHCYIATASAKGHPGFVKPAAVPLPNGQTLLVTKQLQILKAGELVLREVTPNLHRRMRQIYDWIGPKLANRIQGPWSADVGYLFFKPFELVALFLIRWFLPRQMGKVNRFYTGESR